MTCDTAGSSSEIGGEDDGESAEEKGAGGEDTKEEGAGGEDTREENVEGEDTGEGLEGDIRIALFFFGFFSGPSFFRFSVLY